MRKPKLIVVPGEKYGRRVVIGEALSNKKHQTRCLCRCECGREKIVVLSRLRNGDSKSCGCLSRDKARANHLTHGLSDTLEYHSWISMLRRCRNQKSEDWNRYGGRGISVCQEWIQSFEKFLEDMGTRPSPIHQIDRIDNNGNYEPGNCRWVLPAENTRNSSQTKLSWDIVNEIREMRRAGASLRLLGNLVGVTKENIGAICSYKTWIPKGEVI